MLARVAIALLVLVAVAGAINYLRPVPAVAAAALLPAGDVVPGTAPSLPWPARGSGALAVSGPGFVATSGNAQTIPAASVTKVMTAMVVLGDKPLAKGEMGPTVAITDVDVQSYEADLAGGQSVARVEAGEQLSELQLLEGMLIPSANNFAETLARWDAGSIDRFVARMNDLARALRLTSSRFADTSGASPSTVATPSDLIRLGMHAMRNPVFAGIVGLPQVDLPVAGTVYNVDGALGQGGIIGIKTGSGLSAGANFLFAADVAVDGRTVMVFGCVMGQPTLQAAFAEAKALVAAASPVLRVRRVIARNQSIGRYTTPWGAEADLVSTVDVDLAEWPGMVLRQRLDVHSIVVDQPVAPGTAEGVEHVALGDYALDVPLVTADPLYPPGRLWRLTRVAF